MSWPLHAETPSPNQANEIHPMTTSSMDQQVKYHSQFPCKGFSEIYLYGIDHLRGQLKTFKITSPYCKKISCRHFHIFIEVPYSPLELLGYSYINYCIAKNASGYIMLTLRKQTSKKAQLLHIHVQILR